MIVNKCLKIHIITTELILLNVFFLYTITDHQFSVVEFRPEELGPRELCYRFPL